MTDSAKTVLLSLIMLLAACLPAYADDDAVQVCRPVFAAYTIEAGSAHQADTYLTPLRYSGWDAALDYSRHQAMRFAPEHWTMRLHGNLSTTRTLSPAGNSTMWSVMLDLDWAMMRKFRPHSSVTLAIGPGIRLEGGAIYAPRNGNNPVTAKAALTVDATGYAAWRVKIGRLPVTLMYQPSLPLTGVFFSPEYGELYYEIYLGNRSGLAHAAWWGNYFMLDNLVTADLCFGATNLRVGYHGRIFSSEANHIVSRTFTHALCIGVSGEWMSVNPRRGLSPKVKMMSALF